MESNHFINIWEQDKHVPENEKFDSTMITNYLKPKVSKVTWTFSFNLIFYLLALMACIVLLSMNLYVYRNNPVMFLVESGLLIFSLIFLGYGIFIFIKIREINNFSKDLHELLESKIRFLRFHYEIWLIITAAVVWILTFALNTFTDNQDGLYRINKVGFFIIISMVMLIFIYAVQKIAAEINLHHLKVYLTDLEKSDLTHIQETEHNKKKLRWIYLAVIILLTFLVILGIFKMAGII